MRRLFCAFVIICLLSQLTACAALNPGVTDKVIPPENNALEISGKWIVTSANIKGASNPHESAPGPWVSDTLQFTKEAAQIGKYYMENPSYKIKTVKTKEYCLFELGFRPKSMERIQDEIQVYSISLEDGVVCDFIKTQPDYGIAVIDNYILELKKVSEHADEYMKEKAVLNYDSGLENLPGLKVSSASVESGLLLGIRSPASTDGNNGQQQSYEYRTIWINSHSRQLNNISEMDGILLPRKNGFWRADIERQTYEGITEDVLKVNKLFSDSKVGATLNTGSSFWESRTGVLYKKITYIGNDYISLEVNGEGSNFASGSKWKEDRLLTQPIDTAYEYRGVKLGDIEGSSGNEAFERDIYEALKFSILKKTQVDISDVAKENFALVRKTGHWIYKGRTYTSYSGFESKIDFFINIFPARSVVAYDTLWITWKSVKDKVPDAIDVFTSPNMDIAVVVGTNRITVFSIENGELSSQPLKKIQLKKGDVVVMSEWAKDIYVDRWDKIFMSNGGKKIK